MADFKAHDIQVREQLLPKLTGGIDKHHILTYWIDNHGPFTKDFTDKEYTPQAARSVIEHKIAELRTITGDMGGHGSGA